MKVLICVASLACFVALASGVNVGSVCTSNSDCTVDNSRCATYEGCDSKACHCKDGYVQISATSCLKEADIGDACTDDAQCTSETSNSECASNVCRCLNGYEKDGDDCVGKIALGDSGCDSDNVCRAGYCNSGTCECYASQVESSGTCRSAYYGESCSGSISCSAGMTCGSGDTCECDSGKKRDGDTCRYASDGEACDTYDCDTGNSLTCTNNVCVCSTSNYVWTNYAYGGAAMSGCVHQDATTNAARGTSCNQQVTTASAVFCKENDLCGYCPGTSSNTVCYGGAMGVVASTLTVIIAAITSYWAL